MTEDARPHGSTPRPKWWFHLWSLRRLTDGLHHDVQLTARKLDLLEHVGSLALSRLSSLAAREAQLGQAYPTGAERFQYALDKVAQAIGSEVDALTKTWQKR